MKTEIDNPYFAEALFDVMPHIVFFVKDRQGFYSHINQSLLERCAYSNKKDLIGKSPSELFPSHLAQDYQEQDNQVLQKGLEMKDHLELHVYPGGELGWCLTNKIALRNKEGEIIGLSGTSRDLGLPNERNQVYQRIQLAVKYIQENYSGLINMNDLERITKLSTSQIERYFIRIFNQSPRQYMIKIRLDAAVQLLKTTDYTITKIAIRCGYQDHSAFTRTFKSFYGVTPREFREKITNRNRVNL